MLTGYAGEWGLKCSKIGSHGKRSREGVVGHSTDLLYKKLLYERAEMKKNGPSALNRAK
jgi:hypothetical protein